jgi:hypothetical protein
VRWCTVKSTAVHECKVEKLLHSSWEIKLRMEPITDLVMMHLHMQMSAAAQGNQQSAIIHSF